MKTFFWVCRGKGMTVFFFACVVALGLWLPLAAGAEELSTYTLSIENGRFHPETLEVKAGQRFKLILVNHGPEAEEFESLELRKEKVLAPGVTSFLVFAPLRPGIYLFFGEFHPKTAQGRIVAR